MKPIVIQVVESFPDKELDPPGDFSHLLKISFLNKEPHYVLVGPKGGVNPIRLGLTDHGKYLDHQLFCNSPKLIIP